MARTKPGLRINAALFNLRDKPSLLSMALAHVANGTNILLVSDDASLLAGTDASQHAGFARVALDRAPLESGQILACFEPLLKLGPDCIIIDMSWAIANMEGAASIERWGFVADHLSSNQPVISVYDLDLTIEEQLQAAFRVHRQFASSQGLHPNPYWIPPDVQQSASQGEQLMFLLGRAAPGYENLFEHRKSGDMLARGATPSWLPASTILPVVQPAGPKWHIHCLGNLRVLIDGKQVEWRIAGSTPKKTRTLFAYLLQTGDKGAHAEQISELLWPDEESQDVKKARLHHTIAMLRKTLGASSTVIRHGDFYHLNAPRGSWIDIETFEQLCRRGLASLKQQDHEAALQLYLAADKLYAGDLFEDLPRDYTHSEQEDWCMPRRVWLREMALKLQNDLTRTLQNLGRSREALEHCIKALTIDAADDDANATAMRIFAAQGRDEAAQRQYRQYRQAVAAIGAVESAEIKALARALSVHT